MTKPVTVTVAGEEGNPYVEVTVYAFDGETYAGYSAVTDAAGQVVFTLPEGSYHFRANYDGVEFWSGNENTCTIPGCEEDNVILPGGTGEQEVSIDYTYDALNRLISAEYSNGTAFGYTYDAAGNVLTYAETHYGQTKVTNYTYDAANQLLTATEDETVWQYSYDGNGSLIHTNPGSEVANGSTRYTYNTAGYLTKVENFTTEWITQSEMTYDGLGNRLEVTTYTGGEGNTTRYVLDGGAELTAIGAENSTYYLYGLGAIGTFGESWSYMLQDGAGSTRQLVDEEGAVNLSVSYTPWGDTMEIYGAGMLNLGYLGGVYDAGTGLIYMGNGQYYDPSTGRFLTRGVNEESTNPYTPSNSDPAGMLIAPLALLALVFGRKKTRTKFDQFIILFVVVLSVGLSVSAFNWSLTDFTKGGPSDPVIPVETDDVAQAGTDSGDFEVSYYKTYLEPAMNGCMTDQEFEKTKEELLDIIQNEIYREPVLYGLKPDFRGIFIATYYKDKIEKYSTDLVTPMMLAVGISIQSNYMDDDYDMQQQFWVDHFFGWFADEDDGFGVAQAKFSEVDEYFDGADPRDADIGIQIMVKRIEKVLTYSDKASYDGNGDMEHVKDPTDLMIFAIIAQQNGNFLPWDVLSQYNDPIYAEPDGNNSYNINWKSYFFDTYEDDSDEISVREFGSNVVISQGRDYMTHFMLLRAVNNIDIFQKYGIFKHDPNYNFIEMRNLASLSW